MYEYKDYSYIKIILELPYLEGLKILNKIIQREKKRLKERDEDMLFKLFLFDCGNGNFEGSFQDYLDKNRKREEINNIKVEDKKEKEKALIEMSKKIIELDRRNTK
jgi:hypothetical protein